MKLEHSFTVPAPVDQAWATLLDIEGVAPCFPGAALTGHDGDAFSGTVKIKLGPIALTYAGKGRFLERDDAAHTVVIDANGRDRHGNGTAGALVHARMEADGDASTRVVVSTELKVTGRPAQFGRGLIQDVGGRIVGQFADCLAATMAAPAAEDASAGTATASASTAPDADLTPPAAPTLAGATAPRGGPRPAAPRPSPVRPLPGPSARGRSSRPGTAGLEAAGPQAAGQGVAGQGAARQPVAELDLGAAALPVLLRRFAPPALVAVVAAVVAWSLVRRRRR